MSSLIVENCRIESVLVHPNADKLELAIVKGWQCVIGKGAYRAGDLITYIPVDSIIPLALSDRIGVTKYLSGMGKVRCAKLRGEPSFGVIMPHELGVEGDNVADLYGITKYIPPVKMSAGDQESDDPLFDKYTSIENMRNFPTVFEEGEEVVATEKIHGTSSRISIINGIKMAGSKNCRRREDPNSTYWMPWSLESVQKFFADFEPTDCVILYGEIYGAGIQNLNYGVARGYRAFDCKVNGRFLDYPVFLHHCRNAGVEVVPEIYRGPFSLKKIAEVSGGKSTLEGANHIREGVVVKPAYFEQTRRKVGRVILKYVSDAYLLGGTDEDTVDEL